MSTITSKGRKLAHTLAPSIGVPSDIASHCSLLCRRAATLHRLYEEACNGDERYRFDSIASWQTDLERRTEVLERRIATLISELPHVDDQAIQPYFNGDPRGPSVLLVMPDGRTDDFGQRGLVVP